MENGDGKSFTVNDLRGVERPAQDIAKVVGAVDASRVGVKSESKHPFIVGAREGRFLPMSRRVLLRAVMPGDLHEGSILVVDGHVRGAVYHVVEAIAPDVPPGLRVGDRVHHISAAEDRLDEQDASCPYSLVLYTHIIGVLAEDGDFRLSLTSPARNREAYLRERYGSGLPLDTPIATLEKMEAQERRERRATAQWPDKLE